MICQRLLIYTAKSLCGNSENKKVLLSCCFFEVVRNFRGRRNLYIRKLVAIFSGRPHFFCMFCPSGPQSYLMPLIAEQNRKCCTKTACSDYPYFFSFIHLFSPILKWIMKLVSLLSDSFFDIYLVLIFLYFFRPLT